MHISKDKKNFRNNLYLKEADKEFRKMFRAYHKYLAYRNKLLNELTMSENEKLELIKLDRKFCRNVNIARERIKKDDFNVL